MLSYKTSDFGGFVVKLENFFYYSSEKDMEKSISINEAINELHDSIINENFTIFMGAGVSKNVNSNYPVWSGVTQKLKNELHFCFSNDALKVAQKYENKYGYKKIKRNSKISFSRNNCRSIFL